MIKTLQKKFIVTAMLAFTLLMLFLLGTINIINARSSSNQNKQLLQLLTENEAYSSMADWFFNMRPGFLQPPINEDAAMSSVYFTVKCDLNGTITRLNLTHIASVDKDEAINLAAQAMKKQVATGKVGRFLFNRFYTSDLSNETIIFLDTSDEIYSVIRVLILSLILGIFCWGLMFILVVLLSKKAIRPIAENMERQKQFITDAGHEIKTPIAIISANTEAMELILGENKYSKNIKQQADRLTGLTQNLLTLAKLGEKGQSNRKEDVDFCSLLNETADMFSENAKQKNLYVSRNIDENVHIYAEKEHISRLVSILLDNAVKYSNEGGFIEICLKKDDKSVFLGIRNSCEQLPDCPEEKLFDRFYRADKARTQKSGGYGIGLSAAKAIAEVYSGDITAGYEGENVISFTVKMKSVG